jgi:hypothetical protein
VQVVGYETGPGSPGPAKLLLASDGTVEAVELEAGTELAYGLGTRRCAGVIDGTTHHACQTAAGPYCDVHTRTWVCARCRGTCLKDEMDCDDAHAVYLAGFAPDVLKVGVTKRHRLETRFREQGADRGALLDVVSNGRIAREREAALADRFPDRVRVPTKIAGLHRSVDETVWERGLSGFEPMETQEFEYGLDLDTAPVAETLVSGTVRGVTGRVLVIDAGGTTYATDLRSVVGYELTDGRTGRRLQSSLGSFS